MGEGSDAERDVAQARGIAMERYGLSEPSAMALLVRLAKRHGVTVGVIAVAVIVASRRRAEDD